MGNGQSGSGGEQLWRDVSFLFFTIHDRGIVGDGNVSSNSSTSRNLSNYITILTNSVMLVLFLSLLSFYNQKKKKKKNSNPSLSSYILFPKHPSHILGRPKIIHHVFHDFVEIKGR